MAVNYGSLIYKSTHDKDVNCSTAPHQLGRPDHLLHIVIVLPYAYSIQRQHKIAGKDTSYDGLCEKSDDDPTTTFLKNARTT